MAASLQRRILERLDEDPRRPALACVDAHGRFTWRTREQMVARAARAGALLGELGARRGDVVLIVAVEPEAAATATLAAWLAGAVPLLAAPPLVHGLARARTGALRELARRAGARIALVPAALQLAPPPTCIELEHARLLAAADGACAADVERVRALEPPALAALQATSGTTRAPRIALWQQPRVLAAVDGMARGMGLERDDVYLNWTPLYHDMGLVNNLLTCVLHGIPLALLSPLDVVRSPALWMRALADTGATQTWSPNFGYALAAQRCADAELDGLSLAHVRGFWNAAERVHLETFQRFHARFERCGVRWDACKANFGCVEAIGGATFTDPRGALVAERVDLDALRASGVARAADASTRHAQWIVSCGRAYPGLELVVRDADGRALPDGHVGEIGLRGPGRFDGYLDAPEETAAALRGDAVFPGDEGYLRDGELFWTGRASERINLQGVKLDPSDLEPALLAIDGLRKGCFAAFGVDDGARGTERLVVVAELEADAQERAREIAAAARASAARELGVSIDEVVLVAKGALEKTTSGKRRHRAVRELYAAGALAALHRSRAGELAPRAAP